MTVDGKPVAGTFISPVIRPVPLRQSVYEALVELVVGGRLGPGSTWSRPTWPGSWG